MTILVVAATHLEVAALAATLPGARVVVAGMGAVNTAHALTRELLQDRPEVVIQTGIAGAYVPSGLGVGDVALATEEVYGDVGVLTPDGWLSAEEIGIPLAGATETRPARFNHFPLDDAMVARAVAVGGNLVARSGRFLTLAQVTGVRRAGDALYDRFGALCESMEGAAAAHVCALHDVPFLEVRGVSNLVENRDRSRWRIAEAAEAAQRVVRRLVEQPQAWLA
ncbi:MAG TPA: futalosine hydrolase [Chloroflexota bacterium]|nr:futalosine hydrolase [Chloroflexota bacterium]